MVRSWEEIIEYNIDKYLIDRIEDIVGLSNYILLLHLFGKKLVNFQEYIREEMIE